MRLFELVRSEDESGVSGTGIVAEGVVFHDKTIAMRWRSQYKSTAIYNNVHELIEVHGHGGKTVVRFLDE